MSRDLDVLEVLRRLALVEGTLDDVATTLELQGEVLARIEASLVANMPAKDERRAVFLRALATAMSDCDLEFDVYEVLHHRRVSTDLDQALDALGFTDSEPDERAARRLGTLFRDIHKRPVCHELRLVRDGRSWRLVRM